ncbi:midkine b isoform X1 [Nothobranchius furzeri]|uniref:Midkine n=4 Tax=Nothobranchius TaxID=28779 RepID=A0A1A8V9Q3_NOTFU
MMGRLIAITLVLFLVLTADASKRTKHHKAGKHEKSQNSECPAAETRFGKCVPDHGDCGDGLRETICRDQVEKIHCRIPCNWKKDISDCKYRFGPWGPCDTATNTKTRSGTLKRALFNAECQTTIKVSKPCSHKTKKTRGEKSSN